MFKTSTLFFRFTFWPSSWQITISCLLVLMAATRIPCTIIVNFLRLISAALLTAGSHFGSRSSCSLVAAVSVVTRMSPLDSHLAAITLPLMELSFILFMSSTTWVMGRLRSGVKPLGHVITSSLAKRVGISRSCGSPCHPARPLRNAPA